MFMLKMSEPWRKAVPKWSCLGTNEFAESNLTRPKLTFGPLNS